MHRREQPHRIRIASVLRQCPKLLGVLSHGTIVYDVKFSPDGTKVLTCGVDHTARVWDSKSGKELLVLHHDGEVNDARFSPDGLRIVTASGDRTLAYGTARRDPPCARSNTKTSFGMRASDLVTALSPQPAIITRLSFGIPEQEIR